MIITVDELKSVYSDLDFSKFSDERLKRKLLAIESMVRNYTNNNFINRNMVVECYALDNQLHGDFSQFVAGDTIQVYPSGELYNIVVAGDESIEIDANIQDAEKLRVYRVDYPMDIVEGCVELLNYDCNGRTKKGIASESLSRHSVSYVQYNESNSREGYPSEMMNFLRKYTKWRT